MALPLPFSQACENNKQPILDAMLPFLVDCREVFEIGSGTGQHAVHFAANLPHLVWRTSDVQDNVAAIQQRIEQNPLPGLPQTIEFDVERSRWPERVDAFYSANTVHIMPWETVKHMIAGIGRTLVPGGWFFLYGPFKYDGQFTSESNEAFDGWLRQAHAKRGIRDFEAVNELAEDSGLTLSADREMPANNRLLIWRR